MTLSQTAKNYLRCLLNFAAETLAIEKRGEHG